MKHFCPLHDSIHCIHYDLHKTNYHSLLVNIVTFFFYRKIYFSKFTIVPPLSILLERRNPRIFRLETTIFLPRNTKKKSYTYIYLQKSTVKNRAYIIIYRVYVLCTRPFRPRPPGLCRRVFIGQFSWYTCDIKFRVLLYKCVYIFLLFMGRVHGACIRSSRKEPTQIRIAFLLGGTDFVFRTRHQ